MKSFLAIAALAASMMGAANAQIDPTSCQNAGGATYTYALGTTCYKGTVAHADGSGNAIDIVIDINFPVNAPSGQLSATFMSTQYAVFVWDQSQGGEANAPFSFGLGGTPQLTSITDKVNAGAASVTLGGVQLQTKASGGGFANSQGTYVYSGTVNAPAGRWQLKFTTSAAQGSSKNLAYNVAFMPLDWTKGHMSSNPAKAIPYSFGSAGSAAWLPMIGTSSGSTQMYTSITSGYAPATTGMLVQDVTVAATPGTGMTISPALYSGGSTQTPLYTETSNSAKVGHFDFPFAAYPPDWSGKTAGILQTVWTVTYIDTSSTLSTAGVDSTVSPGPFLKLTPGAAAETYTDAVVLNSGSTVSIQFDGSNAGTTSAPRAAKSLQLIRIPIPTDWWAMRFTVTAEATSGNLSPTGTPAEAVGFVGDLKWADYTSRVASAFSIANAFTMDANNQAAYFIPNTGVNSANSAPDRPFSGVTNPLLIAGTSGSDSNNNYNTPNFPLYDNRLARGSYIYLRVCRRNGCSTSPYSTTTNVVTSTVSITWASTMEIQGECSSNADCVSSRPGGHPSQARASHFSANGDVNRFATCMLLPRGDNPNLPESKCVECMSDCDCMPGQFCNINSGVASMSGSAGVYGLIDELTRLRSGICMRKDLNGTQFGKQCHASWSQSTSASVSISPAITSTGAVPYLMGQAGSVPCGDAVFVNASFPNFGNSPFNSTNLTAVYLWQGFCDGNNVCRECARSVASSGASTQCSASQVCLDGMYHPTVSVDQTIRTFTNDTRAGTLLAIVFMLLTLLIGMAVQCYMSRRSGGAAATSTTTNPIAKSMDEARA